MTTRYALNTTLYDEFEKKENIVRKNNSVLQILGLHDDANVFLN